MTKRSSVGSARIAGAEGVALGRRSFLKASVLGGSSVVFGGGLSLAGAQDQHLAGVSGIVKTRHGRVRGLLANGVHQFWSVPYGAPTSGKARFMPPQEPTGWSEIRDQFEIRYRAPLRPGAGPPAPVVRSLDRGEPQGEDCLALNIFTPGLDNSVRPVMVWLHGGGFSGGSGNYLLYDGTNLARKENVVVVSVNHRLNIFGFLHLAEIGDARWENSTNVGMQDIVAALKWIQENIENFGGDPDRVTLFGQSGGGGKATTLMGMPSADGQFHRAIAQSGAEFRGARASDASERTLRFLSKLGVRPSRLEALQQIDFRQIQDAYYSEPEIAGLATGPVIDGRILPAHPWDPQAPRYSANVPLMAGSTETEDGWVGPPPYELHRDEMIANFSDLVGGDETGAQELTRLYERLHPEKRNRMLWLTAQADATRRREAQALCNLKHAQGRAQCYLYFFDWYSPVHDDRMGAYHTLDIPFVFYNMDIGASMTGAAQRRYALGHVMSAAWAAFARSGNPNHADMPPWPEFDSATYPTMMFGDQVRMAHDPNRQERLALAAILDL